ncbi:uncharacterized protein J3D65DRAFT_670600 [Phyllosticta citribraziliensis]|uniref:Uncharacterized protein n=1 Tax=Phyllosticta citribraziliensis TaxID=989973 RepID=A0ABR1L9N7_9PEZI
MTQPSSIPSSPLPPPLPAPLSAGMQRFDMRGAKHLCNYLRRYNHRIIEPDISYGLVQGASNTCGHAISVPLETQDKILAGDIAAPVYCIECLIASYHQAANRLAQRNITRERNPVGPLHKSLVEKVREKVMDIGNLQLLQDNRADWEDSRATKMAARRPQGAALKKVVFADDDIVLARHQSLLDEPTTEEYSNENEETGDMSARSNSPCAGPSV